MKMRSCILTLSALATLVDCTPEDARLVSTAKELGAALLNGSVSTITIKGLMAPSGTIDAVVQ